MLLCPATWMNLFPHYLLNTTMAGLHLPVLYYLANMQATVYKSTGSWYIVKNSTGQFYDARIKGKFKIDHITSTNPIAVGDIVEIENETDTESTVITEIYERRNYINRVSPHNKNQHHIVAANLDQSLLFATLKEPKTSLGFIDRFLVISEAYRVPAIVVFNKSDLYGKKEIEKMELIRSIYEPIGYTIMEMSIEKNIGVEEVKVLLKDKITLLSGHSGVGKSSFINIIFPELKLKTQDVSGWSGKGLHTTTFAEMFDLSFGGQVIDTPGIREMGLVDISKQELAHYFPEMRAVMNDCRFNNCMHLDEPGCAVKNAVNEGRIHAERYISYLNIRDTILKKTY
jgi:ribosome biogenesis GTPase